MLTFSLENSVRNLNNLKDNIARGSTKPLITHISISKQGIASSSRFDLNIKLLKPRYNHLPTTNPANPSDDLTLALASITSLCE